MAFDARMAWMGPYTEDRPEKVHVETAAWQGQPVFFAVSGEWYKPGESSDFRPSFLSVVAICVGVFLLTATVMVARHNLRLGRGDKKGAATIAVVVFLSGFCRWLLGTAHAANQAEAGLVFTTLAWGGFISGVLWLGYIATEPYARKHWPDSLISWNRLLSGRLRDPLVASHILVWFATFCAGGMAILIARAAISAAPVVADNVSNMSSISAFLAALAGAIAGALSPAIRVLVLVVALRLVIRAWIADLIAAVVLVFGGVAVDYTNPVHFAATASAYLFVEYGMLWACVVLAFWRSRPGACSTRCSASHLMFRWAPGSGAD